MRKIFRQIYVQVLIAIVAGALLGHYFPNAGQSVAPLSTAFIKLVKMVTAPLIFVTIVLGAKEMGGAGALGRIGGKSIILFELTTTIALLIGLWAVNTIQPGVGMNLTPSSIDASVLNGYERSLHASSGGVMGFLLGIIPDSAVSAFANADMLQVVLFSTLFAIGLSHSGKTGETAYKFFEGVGSALFGIVRIVMRLAPIGAFGAMAYAVGKFGFGTMNSLFMLLVTVYAATLAYIVLILGGICLMCDVSLWRLLKYIRGEILLVIATVSSEAAFPQLVKKLEALGCPTGVVGIVMPMGYTFNLAGTCVAQVICAVFIAQAFGIQLSVAEQAVLVGISMLTSRGMAGVAGASFICLLATLAAFKHIPIEGAAIVLGVDRFIAEIRATTNMIGNAVATVAVAHWERQRDDVCMRETLGMPPKAVTR
ncbi:cation:dicarboxylase symporter family transporter [Caballeronia sp. LZ029]|uniref:cation:dicarboxylate symporter family transporter n=1 Tax=Caballeronia sp. LZ029 TaxID=3038564 RepID=UPI00045A0D27|nr:cation:dicarboxylase symporter family transporter [Caballeronia sp. LZ029]KAK47748.1 C4-dicarboxylate transporter [Caballeronia jiangsuensis]MDR5746496.1 cation:dicarboxylase symporter family transporter [Caballeronia sp. LZ029]